jgi:hypothetical protein
MWQKICRTDPKRASPQQYRGGMKKRKRRKKKVKELYRHTLYKDALLTQY